MSLPLWTPRPQERKSAPNYVIEQIRNALYAKQLKPGERLPSETELGELFGVSRGSVRQAMKSLESLGVVSIKPGDGTYINQALNKNNFNPLAFALLLSNPSKKTLMDARYALERDICELILEDEEKVAAVIPLLEANIEERRRMLSSGATVDELVKNDVDFHLLLSSASDNLFLKLAYDYIVDAFKPSIALSIIHQAPDPPGGDNTVSNHMDMIMALRNRSFSEVRKASKHSIVMWKEATSEKEDEK